MVQQTISRRRRLAQEKTQLVSHPSWIVRDMRMHCVDY